MLPLRFYLLQLARFVLAVSLSRLSARDYIHAHENHVISFQNRRKQLYQNAATLSENNKRLSARTVWDVTRFAIIHFLIYFLKNYLDVQFWFCLLPARLRLLVRLQRPLFRLLGIHFKLLNSSLELCQALVPCSWETRGCAVSSAELFVRSCRHGHQSLVRLWLRSACAEIKR